MVRFMTENGHCAVKLLNGHYSYHLVGERHLGKGYLPVSACIDGVAETVRATDNKCEVFAGGHLLLQIIGELNRAEFASVFVE